MSLTAHHTIESESESCFHQVGLAHILLQLALGHSLPCSRSRLALLPQEVLQKHLATQVRYLFFQDLQCRGLVTPVDIPAHADLLHLPPVLLAREPPPLVRKIRTHSALGPVSDVTRNRFNLSGLTKQGQDDDERAEMAGTMLRAAFSSFPTSPLHVASSQRVDEIRMQLNEAETPTIESNSEPRD